MLLFSCRASAISPLLLDWRFIVATLWARFKLDSDHSVWWYLSHESNRIRKSVYLSIWHRQPAECAELNWKCNEI